MRHGALFLWQAALLGGGVLAYLSTGFPAAKTFLSGEVVGVIGNMLLLGRLRRLLEERPRRVLLATLLNFSARAALLLLGLLLLRVERLLPAATYLGGYFLMQAIMLRAASARAEGGLRRDP